MFPYHQLKKITSVSITTFEWNRLTLQTNGLWPYGLDSHLSVGHSIPNFFMPMKSWFNSWFLGKYIKLNKKYIKLNKKHKIGIKKKTTIQLRIFVTIIYLPFRVWFQNILNFSQAQVTRDTREYLKKTILRQLAVGWRRNAASSSTNVHRSLACYRV